MSTSDLTRFQQSPNACSTTLGSSGFSGVSISAGVLPNASQILCTRSRFVAVVPASILTIVVALNLLQNISSCLNIVSVNGWLIRKRLLELGLTDTELAVRLKKSPSTVRNMLLGRNVHDRTAYDAAIILGVELAELAPEVADRLLPPTNKVAGGNK